jgi:hypothetical protein
MFRVLALLGFMTFATSAAHAACSNPNGEEAEFIYNGDHKVMQFCNGTNWISMASSFTQGAWQVSGTHVLYNDGNVGIGTDSPNAKLSVAGNVSASSFNATFTTVTASSPTSTGTKYASVSCPSGYTMTGGGCNATCCGSTIIYSYPTSNGWTCASYDSYTTAYATSAYARCMKTSE